MVKNSIVVVMILKRARSGHLLTFDTTNLHRYSAFELSIPSDDLHILIEEVASRNHHRERLPATS